MGVEKNGSAPGEAGRPVLVVVPTFNEVENVEPLSMRVLAALPGAAILFVDDSSPDGTAAEVLRLRRSEPRVDLLSRPRKLGLGSAHLAGFDHAIENGFEMVATMDGDLSHDPALLPVLLAGAEARGVAIGSRYVEGGGVENWPAHRRWLSRWANLVARRILSLSVNDCTSGFRAYRTSVLRRLPLSSIRGLGYCFLEEMALLVERHGIRPLEVPILFVDRRHGRSKITGREVLAAAVHVVRLKMGSGGVGRPPRAAPGQWTPEASSGPSVEVRGSDDPSEAIQGQIDESKDRLRPCARS